jgi:signal transduction histidine kinase
VVSRAARSAHAAFRVVQESLTNALRYAPGADVLVLMRGSSGAGRRALRVRVPALGGTYAAGPSRDGGWYVDAYLSG